MTVDTVINQASSLFAGNDFKKAITLCNKALKAASAHEPKCQEKLYYWRGRAEFELGNLDQAIADLVQAQKVNSKVSAETLLWLGSLYVKKAEGNEGFYLKANTIFRKALDLTPPPNIEVNLRMNLGTSYLLDLKVAASKRQFDIVRKQFPDQTEFVNQVEAAATKQMPRRIKTPELLYTPYAEIKRDDPHRHAIDKITLKIPKKNIKSENDLQSLFGADYKKQLAQIEQALVNHSLPLGLVIKEVRSAGQGVFLSRSSPAIPANTILGVYSGIFEYYSKNSFVTPSSYRWNIYSNNTCYLDVDSAKQGNYTRFINHFSEPNVQSLLALHNGTPQVLIYTKVAIHPGEGIGINYDPDKQDWGYWTAQGIDPISMTPKNPMLRENDVLSPEWQED